jgi:hypothetical protein
MTGITSKRDFSHSLLISICVSLPRRKGRARQSGNIQQSAKGEKQPIAGPFGDYQKLSRNRSSRVGSFLLPDQQ